MNNIKTTSSYDVYRSPEFVAFCRRFGIAHELGTRDLTIRLPFEGVLTVVHEYLPSQLERTDTTTNHNNEYHTHIPTAFVRDCKGE